ncbi:MAG: helix-turn-helix domain containing protein [Spirochaetales bacterium]|nr:helix-turn-helix domain containing protein [Spirochaetales bacterium]
MSQTKSERVKALIISEAKKMFIERGYHGMNYRDLAKETGLSPAAPYHRFKNKLELFEACIDGAELTFDCAAERPLEFTMLLEKTLQENGGIISKLSQCDPEVLFSLV